MDRPLARMCSDRRDGFGEEPTTLVNRLYGVRTGTQVRKRPSVAVNSFEGFSGGQQRPYSCGAKRYVIKRDLFSGRVKCA